MDARMFTRRQAIGAAAGLCSMPILGCGDKGVEKPARIESSSEETPMVAIPAPTLGWEVIASGNAGPGVRSRHGLVYDRSTKAAVLFASGLDDVVYSCEKCGTEAKRTFKRT